MVRPPPPHRVVLGGLVLALAIPPAGLAQELTAPALRRAGWEPATSLPPVSWHLDLPQLPRVTAARLLRDEPSAFPRPALVRDATSLPLPLEPALERLQRLGDGAAATVTWSVAAEAVDVGAGVVAVDVDVEPWRARPAQAAVVPEDGDPKPDLGVGPSAVPEESVGWRRDPTRRHGPDPAFEREVLSAIHRPSLVATPATAVSDDATLATADSGATWLRLELEDDERHDLSPAEVFGATGASGPALLVAPRPRRAGAALELFEVGADAKVTSLGSPRLTAAGWSQSVSDVRIAPGGVHEAVVMVHDVSRKRPRPLDAWGAVVRRAPSGAWWEERAFSLPEGVSGARVRFGAKGVGGLDLVVGGQVIAHQAPPAEP